MPCENYANLFIGLKACNQKDYALSGLKWRMYPINRALPYPHDYTLSGRISRLIGRDRNTVCHIADKAIIDEVQQSNLMLLLCRYQFNRPPQSGDNTVKSRHTGNGNTVFYP